MVALFSDDDLESDRHMESLHIQEVFVLASPCVFDPIHVRYFRMGCMVVWRFAWAESNGAILSSFRDCDGIFFLLDGRP